MVRALHPDVNPNPDAQDRFIEIQKAYEILSDPAQKLLYDTQLLNQELPKTRPPEPKPRPRPEPPPPKPTQAQVRVSHGADLLKMTSFLTQGRLKEAERLAEKVRQENPSLAVPHAVLGDISRIRGDLKAAAAHYALATQMEPKNLMFLRKYEDVLAAQSRLVGVAASPVANRTSSMAVTTAFSVTAVAAAYVAMSNEPPVMPFVGLLSTWTLGLIAMLLISGVTIGACLSFAGYLDSFTGTLGSAASRIPPSFLLGGVAMIQFWVAALLYFMISSTQDSFNLSTNRALGLAGVGVLVMTLASAMSTNISWFQTLMWGGNILYSGLLAGWMFADSMRTSSV